MDLKNAIEIRNVSKSFTIQIADESKKTISGKTKIKKIKNKVLDSISLDIKKGDVLGILGRNGSGKSTFLSLLARIMEPDEGSISRSGKIAAILELGMGFHPDMTGRENIYTKGELYGFSKKEMDSIIEKIIDYSGVRKYIDNPVRTYSSGMIGRLAFAIMVNVNSDIILVDEVLSVGDSSFSTKAMQHFNEMAESGKTVLIVSHNLGYVEKACNRVIWIENGKIAMDGNPEYVCAEYQNRINEDPEIIQELAQSGVPDAQYKLSLMYRDGNHFQKDLAQYENWLASAADRRSVRAQVVYGDLLMSRGLKDRAYNYYYSAAERGDWEARVKVASFNSSTEEDTKWLVELYEESLIPGNGIMEFRFGELLLKIAWDDEGRKKAFEMFLKSANDGFVDAMHQVALMYRDGIGTAKNYDNMIIFLTKAAEKGLIHSISLLISIYEDGKLLPKNKEATFKWALKAAKLGHRDYMYRVAVMYRDGVGTEKDKKESDIWFYKYKESYLFQQYVWATNYERAYNNNNNLNNIYDKMISSMNSVMIYQNITNTEDPEKKKKLLSLLEFLAESGNIDAINRLGNMYYDGLYVKADSAKSFYWYEKGAKEGNGWSQGRVGEMYRDGKGVKKNVSLAIYNFKNAAINGDIRCSEYLIHLSFSNKDQYGEDFEWALNLLKKHAESGNIDAINRLGNMYYRGISVEKNIETALKWYKLGANVGDKNCIKRCDEIIQQIERDKSQIE